MSETVDGTNGESGAGRPESPAPAPAEPLPEAAPAEAVAAGEAVAESAAPAPPKSRSRVPVQILLGIAILLCGMLIGAGATVLVGRTVIVPGGRPPAQASGAIARQMSRRLNLTPQQQTEVRRILREHMERVNQIRNEGRQEAKAEFDAMRDEVAKVLTPQQAQMWRREFDRMRRLAPQPHGGRWEPPPVHPEPWDHGPRGQGGPPREGPPGPP